MHTTHLNSTRGTALRLFSVFAITGLLGLATAHAQLVTYQFSSNGNPSSPAENLTASTAAWSGISGSTVGLGGSLGTAFARFDTAGTSFDTNEYLTVTLTADAGYVLNLTSLTIDIGGSNSNAVSRTSFAQIRSDAESTDFSTSLTLTPGSVTEAQVALSTTVTTPIYTAFTVDLSGVEFQSVSGITLRIYAYGSAAVTTAFWRADNLVINGTVTAANIPEPSTYALIMGGGLLVSVIGLRRRNTR